MTAELTLDLLLRELMRIVRRDTMQKINIFVGVEL
jgi:hypothetical protein